MIGLIGTGLMGFPISERLLREGHAVRVYNRTRSKAEPLTEHGAEIGENPGAVIGVANPVILTLTDYPAIRAVLFNRQLKFQDTTIIQMGTIAPGESRELHAEIRERCGDYLEAPVLGNKHHARDGELDIMVGCTDSQFTRWSPTLEVLGKAVRHVGPAGSAAALKLSLNQFIATLTASFGFSLRLAQENDVDTDLFLEVLRESPLYAAQYDKKLPRIQDSDYSDPNFPTRHLLKDLDLMIEAGERAEISGSLLKGVREIMEKAIEKGYGDTDYSSLVEGLQK